MIEHIVLFKVKDGTSQDKIDLMLEGLRSLSDSIDGITGLSTGLNFSERSKGFTHGLVVRFDSRAALDAYGPHPAHQKVVEERIKPIIDDIVAVDYEF